MELSRAGLDIIKRSEGLRLRAYKAVSTETHYTIGYGHYGPDVGKTQVITEVEAENLLKKDVARFVAAVNKLVKVPLNQNQFDALVSFTYNVGESALEKSTLLKYLNEKEYDLAAKEFDRWNKSGGQVLLGLVNRRNEEQALFLKPVALPTKRSYVVSYDIVEEPSKASALKYDLINKGYKNVSVRLVD